MKIFNCIICIISFSSPNKNAKFCSLQCKYKSMGKPKISKICVVCNKEFKHYESNQKNTKFCSLICKRNFNSNLDNKLKKAIQTFEKKVIKQAGCWDWKGPYFKFGYGQIWFNKRVMNASRFSWIIHNGDINDNLWVLHTCDNPKCTNPAHLYLGTCQDNVNDMISRQRRNMLKGEKVYLSKLKEKDVIEIKDLLKEGKTLRELSNKFNVSISCISAIKVGRNWK